MSLAASIAAAFCLSYAGLAALCLAMNRHQLQVWRRALAPGAARMLRVAGWWLVAGALLPCIGGWGTGIGVVAWFGLLSAAALALVFLLPYLPRFSVGLAVPALLAGVLLSI